MARTLSRLPVQLGGLVSSSISTKITRAYATNATGEFYRLARNSTLIILLGAATWALVSSVYLNTITLAWIKRDGAIPIAIYAVLCLAGVVSALQTLFSTIVAATGNLRYLAIAAGMTSTLGCAAAFFAAKYAGLEGVTLAIAAIEFSMLAASGVVLWRSTRKN